LSALPGTVMSKLPLSPDSLLAPSPVSGTWKRTGMTVPQKMGHETIPSSATMVTTSGSPGSSTYSRASAKLMCMSMPTWTTKSPPPIPSTARHRLLSLLPVQVCAADAGPAVEPTTPRIPTAVISTRSSRRLGRRLRAPTAVASITAILSPPDRLPRSAMADPRYVASTLSGPAETALKRRPAGTPSADPTCPFGIEYHARVRRGTAGSGISGSGGAHDTRCQPPALWDRGQVSWEWGVMGGTSLSSSSRSRRWWLSSSIGV
jgi:hypothetical protein